MPRALTTDFMCFLGTFAHAIPFACSVFAFCFYQLWNICQFLGYISDVASCIKTFWSRTGSHSLHLLGQSGSERGSLLRNPQSLSYALRRPHRALHCGYSWTCPIKRMCSLFLGGHRMQVWTEAISSHRHCSRGRMCPHAAASCLLHSVDAQQAVAILPHERGESHCYSPTEAFTFE